MYDRANRFKKVYFSTPARVGPATYILYDSFDKISGGCYAPFNSAQIRDTTFFNKNLAENPSPQKYKICFRKNRIIGGTSLHNRAPRFQYKTRNLNKGPYPSAQPYKTPGKLFTGVPPRNQTTAVSSIPEKGTRGYHLTDEGPVKIQNPPQDLPIGPTTYYNPEGHHNYTTEMYKGIFWSLKKSKRFSLKKSSGPGPAEYTIGQPEVSDFQKFQEQLQSLKKAEAPLLRSSDILQRKLCRENLPGPGSYSPIYQDKKCECGKFGSFTRAQRQNLYKTAEGPGPADYFDPRTAIHKAVTSSIPRPLATEELSRPSKRPSPGPGEYHPKGTMWDEIQRKGHSKYAQWNAPFDSSAERNISFTNSDSACIPGPDWYYPELHGKENDSKKSSMFASNTSRGSVSCKQVSPGPANYSIAEPYRQMFNSKSHLKGKAPFLSKAIRLRPFGSEIPGPGTYDVENTTLTRKGCTIGERLKQKCKEVTPGPLDYVVHPKCAKSTVYDTHNITLKKEKTLHSQHKPTVLRRKLRCFSLERRYKTKHCPIEIQNIC